MTTPTSRTFSWKNVAENWKTATILAAAAATVFGVMSQLAEIGQAVTDLPQFQQDARARFEAYDEALLSIRSDIAAIQSDQKVIEISRYSAVVPDQCSGIPGTPCLFDVIVRRVSGMEDCEFTRVEDYVASVADLQPIPVERLKGPNINIGSDWTHLLIEIELPATLRGAAGDYFFAAFYANCPNIGETSQLSPPISFPVNHS